MQGAMYLLTKEVLDIREGEIPLTEHWRNI